MKLIFGILIFYSLTFAKNGKDTDVKHMIVLFNGKTIVGYVDSLDVANVYYRLSDSLEPLKLSTWKVYYIYNDFNRVFYYSLSFKENMQRVSNRPGKLFTIDGDTIQYQSILANDDFFKPQFLITTAPDKSIYYSMLDVEKVVTDYSVLEYSVERGAAYSSYLFGLAFLIDFRIKDFLPQLKFFGMNKTGVTYESFVTLIPGATISSLIWDLWKDKRSFYFTPIFEQKKFGRNMYIGSLKHVLQTVSDNIIFRLEKTKIGGKVIRVIRKKIS